MARLTRPGGIPAFSCASGTRPEHGTTRIFLTPAPGPSRSVATTTATWPARTSSVRSTLDGLFCSWDFLSVRTSFDLYLAGVPAGPADAAVIGRLPNHGRVTAIAALMQWPHRLLRLPLRAMLVCLPEQAYQAAALRYWRVQERAQGLPALARFRRSPRA